MNQDQVNGLLRIAVPAVCAWAAGKGASWFGSAEVQAQLVAVVIGVAALVWSYVNHTDGNKLRAAASIDPNLKIAVPLTLIGRNPSVAKVVADEAVKNVDEAP